MRWMRELLASSLETAQLGPDGFADIGHDARIHGGRVHRLADHQGHAGQRGRRRVKPDPPSPLVPGNIPIYRLRHDARSGRHGRGGGNHEGGCLFDCAARPARQPLIAGPGRRPTRHAQ